MKKAIVDLYIELTQRARKRFSCLETQIPKKVAPSELKSAPTRTQVKAQAQLQTQGLELGSRTVEAKQVVEETETTMVSEAEAKEQARRLAENKAHLEQNIANLKAIIPILKEDKSKKLMPILKDILTQCETALGTSHVAAKPTFTQRELVESDLIQLRGLQIGIQALQTLATIYNTELYPLSENVIPAIEAKYKATLNPPGLNIDAYRAGGMGMGMVIFGFPH